MGARTPIGVMLWMSTLGPMIAEGTRVRRTCNSPCSFWEDVDLPEMVRLLGGPEFSLWDCRLPCEICGRRTHFMASPGPGAIFRPLLSTISDPESLPPEAWMAGWTGRR